MNCYDTTKEYWDKIFDPDLDFEPLTPVGKIEIDHALKWLCEIKGAVLDFGCANGTLSFSALYHGAEKVIGIDISENALNQAKTITAKHGLEKKATFILGGAEDIENVSSFSGAILFNIIDNILPDDAQKVVSSIAENLKPGARLILKLNPLQKASFFEGNKYYKKVSQDFYKETSGLYLHNISKEKLLKMMKGFDLKKEVEVFYEEYKISNRLFYFEKY